MVWTSDVGRTNGPSSGLVLFVSNQMRVWALEAVAMQMRLMTHHFFAQCYHALNVLIALRNLVDRVASIPITNLDTVMVSS